VRRAAIALVALAACAGDTDPVWQLDHDRIVAVRASAPGLAPGDRASLDALLATKGQPTRVAPPEAAQVVSPASLADALQFTGGAWVVTAPSAARLDAARAELALAAGAPVPLVVGVSFVGGKLIGTKTIALGAAAANPTLPTVMIDGKAAPAGPISVAKLVAVPLALPVDDATYDVAWVTSCGTMHDDDLPTAYLKVEAKDRATGELGVVLRDAHGGVAWAIWPISAQ
jgi:hypothetical protein